MRSDFKGNITMTYFLVFCDKLKEKQDTLRAVTIAMICST